MSNNLTKRHIVQKIYEQGTTTTKMFVILCKVLSIIMQEAISKGQNIELRKFGVFELQVRKSRVGRNPTNQKRM
jgi:nucleoid DNA-binding protein